MRMAKILYAIVFLSLCLTFATHHLHAQSNSSDYNKISGFVISEKDSEFCIPAKVEILELHRESYPDINGKFIFNNLPSGSYTLRVSSLAMDTIIVPSITIPRCDNPLIIMLRWNDICHDAAAQARKDLASGKVYLMSGGLKFVSSFDQKINVLRDKYGFQSYDTGCVIIGDCNEQYNAIVMIYLNLRNGKGWIDRFNREADSIRTNYKW